MSDEYVGRIEFNTLKEEVDELKMGRDEDRKLLLNKKKIYDIINKKEVK